MPSHTITDTTDGKTITAAEFWGDRCLVNFFGTKS